MMSSALMTGGPHFGAGPVLGSGGTPTGGAHISVTPAQAAHGSQVNRSSVPFGIEPGHGAGEGPARGAGPCGWL